MVITIDIGGTKTLVGFFEGDTLIASEKFPTDKNYTNFLVDLKNCTQKLNQSNKIIDCVSVAAPGIIDRKNNRFVRGGNLVWVDVGIGKDLEEIYNCPVYLENDANLAGLSEAYNGYQNMDRVTYITISTGIGIGVVTQGYLDNDFLDTEPGQIYLYINDKLQAWEDISSGSAIVAKYGQRASDINDPEIWNEISRGIAIGLFDIIAIINPSIIIVGGGVGQYYDKMRQFVENIFEEISNPMIKIPPIVIATNPETAVIYGANTYAKQQQNSTANN